MIRIINGIDHISALSSLRGNASVELSVLSGELPRPCSPKMIRGTQADSVLGMRYQKRMGYKSRISRIDIMVGMIQ